MTASPPVPDFTKPRDLHAVEAVLVAWLPTRAGNEDMRDLRVGNFERPVGAGASNETILFDAEWTERGEAHRSEWVLRVGPGAFQLFLDPAFPAQFELLDVLHREDLVKVPEVFWYEDDAALLGQPFFLMARMRGRVPVSHPVYNGPGWLADATPAERRALWESAFRELTRIQAVPVDHVRFLDKPHLGNTGLEQKLALWERSVGWSTADQPPDFIVEVAEWLRANVPTASDGLSWGDARMGNMMFGDDYRLIGVMDWEQASLAGGACDLGWWMFFDDFHSIDHGLPRLDGLGTRQESLDLWTELVGTAPPDLQWYEVFAGFTVILLSLRTQMLHGAPPGLLQANNPFVGRTCELLGWPRPKLP